MFHKSQLLALLLASTALCRSLGNLNQGMLHERSLPTLDEFQYHSIEKRGLIKREDDPPAIPGLDPGNVKPNENDKPDAHKNEPKKDPKEEKNKKKLEDQQKKVDKARKKFEKEQKKLEKLKKGKDGVHFRSSSNII
ncbi:hypothetical protein PtB15_6B847 [Puccinia triticina]|nr:hypothetical protein PtB15_6B847 [Puccinia triticina]